MTEFKVGDRVAVYSSEGRHTGEIGSFGEAGALYIRLDRSIDGADIMNAYPKECRRLVPCKPRRRIWLNKRWVDGEDIGEHAVIAIRGPYPNVKGDMVEFREVRKRKVGEA